MQKSQLEHTVISTVFDNEDIVCTFAYKVIGYSLLLNNLEEYFTLFSRPGFSAC